jgi:hypothetical protein
MHILSEKTFAFRSMFFHPATTLDTIQENPQWFCPLLFAAVFSAAANSYMMFRIGIVRLVGAALKASGAIDPKAVLDGAAAQKTGILIFQGLGTMAGTFITALVAAKVIWLLLIMFGEDIGYRKVLAVVAHVNMLTIVIRETMMVLTMTAMRDLDGFNLQNPLATNLAFFLNPSSPAAFHLLRSLDLISFANIFLLALGLSKLSLRFSIRQANALVIIPWGIYLAVSLLLPFPA